MCVSKKTTSTRQKISPSSSYFLPSKSTDEPLRTCNSDGELLCFCDILYQLTCSPIYAFQYLIPLFPLLDPDEILKKGKFNKRNELVSIDFPWLKNRKKDNILGYITINKNQLSVGVNSLERKEGICKEIEKRLPEARLKEIKVRSLKEEDEKNSQCMQLALPLF